MTVAAVILAASPENALADANGLAAVRRIADIAWSGGATPIVVVSFDPDGAVAAALAGAPVTLAEPAPREGGPVAQIRRGIDVARAEITATDGVLVWPTRMTWVGPETVTSLIEAHGIDPGAVLRPAFDGEAGWPALLSLAAIDALARVAPDRMPDAVVDEVTAAAAGGARALDLGDPGTTHDRSTPFADLPPYVGPTDPVVAHSHEWGAAIATDPDDVPLTGPALAPYEQAEAET